MKTQPAIRLIATFLCTCMLFLLASCDSVTPKKLTIGEILKDPTSYEGKEIKISGKVIDVLKIPLVDVKLYVVDDETGSITVVTEGNTPGLNKRVKIKGVIDNLAIAGGQSIGIHLKEIKRMQ